MVIESSRDGCTKFLQFVLHYSCGTSGSNISSMVGFESLDVSFVTGSFVAILGSGFDACQIINISMIASRTCRIEHQPGKRQ